VGVQHVRVGHRPEIPEVPCLLSDQAALRPARIRETYDKHGRGAWLGIYGDNPAFTYIPWPRPDGATLPVRTWPYNSGRARNHAAAPARQDSAAAVQVNMTTLGRRVCAPSPT
jgi:hypothetical protein